MPNAQPPAHTRPLATLARPTVREILAEIPWRDLSVPLAVLSVVLAMIAPVPPFLLDALIALNITLSVVVMLVGMYIVRPADFNVFPTTLLLLTLFRLALNISSSRLILLAGNTGTSAAGHVIEAFGSFVVGGNYIIGAVIFLVLTAIQYVVINHGAVRISEVTARFTLDALPGKQMSIDSDLNAGLIDEAEARRRRKELAAEAEFYGAMDGASRFTQRDAVASVLITAINIVAGFLIGVLQHGMDLDRALQTYTVLTIGDGLVTVIPALMVSVSGGLIVTRASSEARLAVEFERQIFSQPQPLLLAAAVLAALALFPGLPAVPFLLLSGAAAWAGWRLRRRRRDSSAAEAHSQPAPAAEREDPESLLRVDLLAVEVGLGLVRLVEGGRNSPLLRRIAGIRRQLAAELGYVLPPVRVTDNLSLKPGEYVVLLKTAEIARFEMPQGFELAIYPGDGAPPPLDGTRTREPAFGMPAWWVPAASADAARASGYAVVDPVSVLGTHLAELVRRHAHELLTRQEAKKLVDRVSEEHPKVVEDLVPKLLPLSTVQRVLQNLLRERVSIRDAVSILESLGEASPLTKNPVLLTECARQALRRVITKPFLDSNGELPAYFLDPSLEQSLEAACQHSEQGSQWNLSPEQMRGLTDRILRVVGSSEPSAVILCSSPARYFLRQLIEPALPSVAVLGHGEVPPGVTVRSRGIIS